MQSKSRIAATAPRLKTLRVTEKDVARAAKDFMAAKGFRCVRMQRTVIPGAFQSGEPGIPDLLFLRYFDGAIIWIETKAPGSKRSQDQVNWHRNEVTSYPCAEVWTIDSLDELAKDFSAWESTWHSERGR